MKGGEAVTHYIPALCERNGRQERAVCGEWIRAHEFSTEPTCATCRAYLAADAALGGDPFGTSVSVNQVSVGVIHRAEHQ